MSLEVSSLRALAHPVRLRILSLLTGTALSAAEIARELGITQANASYHVRTLAAAGYLTEVGEETIRGGVARRYAYVPGQKRDGAGQQAASDPEGHALVYQAVSEELVRRSRHVRPGLGSMTDAELWVDPQDWQRAVDLVVEAAEVLHRRAHPPRTEGTVHVNATIAMFRMGDEPHQREGEDGA
jgi:DNA-binding transcriptional ArsR family regulator